MINTEVLKQAFLPILEESGVSLYELKWTNVGKERTLQVAILKPDGTLDLNTCADVSEKLSTWLDENDHGDDSYTLEVCSPGAEREIRDLNELKQLTEPYVFLRLKHPINKMLEFTGTITSYDETIKLEYRDKARLKKIEIQPEDIDYIRLAVKF